MTHALRKLSRTIKIAATMALARTFGTYEHSGWNGEFDYCRYTWRGKSWVIPQGRCHHDHPLFHPRPDRSMRCRLLRCGGIDLAAVSRFDNPLVTHQ